MPVGTSTTPPPITTHPNTHPNTHTFAQKASPAKSSPPARHATPISAAPPMFWKSIASDCDTLCWLKMSDDKLLTCRKEGRQAGRQIGR